ncbi:methyltransferase domain-containing protein [Sphingomonas sp.]|jgi:tRNA (cmo5U34)-methyltransferase|uniref:methyltransferase domain-containing protein n=1 Tax=Sphingomonas sp. TaxID=28214 RepID=UPI002E335E2E|nr:methyltransferase domain-containing protein [Sphingomonas sp.]HEX4693575.1 methyltransferase domain-containing protein [Sphingomonas sp.]
MATLDSQVCGDNIAMEPARWNFGGDVPGNFVAHAQRSIPYYTDCHELVARISDYFVSAHSTCYDLGASTGRLLHLLAPRHASSVKWVGIDCEAAMVREAQAALATSGDEGNITIVEGDICDYDYAPADLIIAYYTIQFVPPRRRQQLIDRLYRSLNWGGALLLFEKVRAPDARFQDMAAALYTEMKIEHGYSAEEILAKSRSLKGVLEPFSTEGNLSLLQRAGFVDVMSVFKYVCFEGFLAIR